MRKAPKPRRRLVRHRVAVRSRRVRFFWESAFSALRGAIVFFGVAAAGFWLLFEGPSLWNNAEVFRVKEVLVRPAAYETLVPLMGISAGDHLFKLPLRQIREKVLAHDRRVKEVRFHRSWTRRLTVNVSAREPLLRFQRGGLWMGIDAEGVVFPVPERLSLDDVRILMDNGHMPGEEFHRFLSVLNQTAVPWVAGVRKVGVLPPNDVLLFINDVMIDWGVADASPEVVGVKAQRLQQVLDDITPETVESLMFVTDARVVVKPRQTQ